MTKQELKDYEKLQDVFQLRCEAVCRILTPLKDAYYYVYDFEITGNLVECEGVENWSYGGEIKYNASFPKEYLYTDDSIIQKAVDDELKRREDEESRKKANEEKIKAEKEKAEYERLKKIFG
jgi:hypothetical protein